MWPKTDARFGSTLEAHGPSGSLAEGVGILVSSRHRSESVAVPGIYGWRQCTDNEREPGFGVLAPLNSSFSELKGRGDKFFEGELNRATRSFELSNEKAQKLGQVDRIGDETVRLLVAKALEANRCLSEVVLAQPKTGGGNVMSVRFQGTEIGSGKSTWRSM